MMMRPVRPLPALQWITTTAPHTHTHKLSDIQTHLALEEHANSVCASVYLCACVSVCLLSASQPASRSVRLHRSQAGMQAHRCPPASGASRGSGRSRA